MKRLKLLALTALTALFTGATFMSGCASGYKVYTNIPNGNFTLGGDCSLGGIIAGCTAETAESDSPETQGYVSKRRLYYGIMTTDAELVVAYPDGDGAEERYNQFAVAVGGVLNSINSSLSTTVESSDISRFNALPAGEEIQINSITYDVLTTAKSVYSLTNGSYNPALYYNVLIYGFGGADTYPKTEDELPDDETISKYTELSRRFADLELREEEGRHYVKKPDYTVTVNGETLSLKLDLGGIGKGYAVDVVDELFDEYGYEYGYFNLGTSSMLIKSNVQQGTYNLGLAHPRSYKRDPYLTVSIRNEKLSTSGDNNQFYTVGNVRYCHVIDPETGKPVQTGIMSASVIGGSAAESDALTTAIMAMGKERAMKFIEEKLTDRKVVFICE